MHFEKFLQFVFLTAYTIDRHNQDTLYVSSMVILYLGERFWMVMIRFYFFELCHSFQLLCFTDEELFHCFNVYVVVSLLWWLWRYNFLSLINSVSFSLHSLPHYTDFRSLGWVWFLLIVCICMVCGVWCDAHQCTFCMIAFYFHESVK